MKFCWYTAIISFPLEMSLGWNMAVLSFPLNAGTLQILFSLENIMLEHGVLFFPLNFAIEQILFSLKVSLCWNTAGHLFSLKRNDVGTQETSHWSEWSVCWNTAVSLFPLKLCWVIEYSYFLLKEVHVGTWQSPHFHLQDFFLLEHILISSQGNLR